MNIWLGECRKLYQNKIFLVTVALLLTVSAILCLRTPRTVRYGEHRGQVDACLEEYRKRGTAYEKEVRARVRMVQDYEATLDSFSEPNGKEQSPQLRAAYETYIADSAFIRFLDNTRRYESTLQDTIETARLQHYNYLQSGRQESDFVVRYQVGMINHYTRQLQKNIVIPAEIVDGWDVILKDQGYLPFYLAALLILGALLLLPEKGTMLPLLRTTRRGRLSLIFAKLLAGAVGSIVLLLAFAVLHGVLIVSRTGIGGALLPLQSVFTTAPFACSVIGGVLLQLALRAMGGIGLVWLMLLLSIFTKRYVSLLGIGGGVLAASYGLSLLGRWNAHGPIGQLNLMDILQGNDFLTRWNAFRIGKSCVVLQKMLVPWLLGIAMLLFILTAVTFCRCRVSGRVQSTVLIRLRKVIPHRQDHALRRADKKARTYSVHIGAWELHKLVSQQMFSLLLLLLIAAEYHAVDTYYAPNETLPDALYHEYMTLLEGEYSEQTQITMQEEKDKLRAAADAVDEGKSRFENGEITYEEYGELIAAGNLAMQRLEHMERVDEKLHYLSMLHAEGKAPYVLYDTGWLLFLQEDEDVCLIAFLILTLAAIFADEHTGGFSSVLYSTPRGRRCTFAAKMAWTVAFTTIMTLAAQAARWLILMKNYDLPALHAPAYSLMGQSIPDGSVLQVTLTTVLLRTLGMVLLSLIIVALSALFRATVPTVILTSLTAFTAKLLTLFGEDALPFLFPNSYLAGFPLLTQSDLCPWALAYACFALLLTFFAAWRERVFSP
ncbi:MAG: hypothetical protein IJW40_09625 [Clostridia bacterium]|nr:hypothetical protein [Clostridia bacterium]